MWNCSTLRTVTDTLFPVSAGSEQSRGSYGPADYDVRHAFNENYVWEVPVKAALGGRGPDSLGERMAVSGNDFLPARDYLTRYWTSSSRGNIAAQNYFGLLYAVPVGPLGSGPSCGKGAAIPLAPNPCQTVGVFYPTRWHNDVNANAQFVQAGCETGFNTGNLPARRVPVAAPAVSFAQGRNRSRGPGYFTTDFAIMKITNFGDGRNASLVLFAVL